MAHKDHPKLNPYLKDGDPAKKPLDANRAALLKSRILAEAECIPHSKPFSWRPFLLAGACALFIGFGIWWQKRGTPPTRDVVQTASQQNQLYENLRQTKVSELRFTTSSGTRIIWQFQSSGSRTVAP